MCRQNLCSLATNYNKMLKSKLKRQRASTRLIVFEPYCGQQKSWYIQMARNQSSTYWNLLNNLKNCFITLQNCVLTEQYLRIRVQTTITSRCLFAFRSGMINLFVWHSIALTNVISSTLSKRLFFCVSSTNIYITFASSQFEDHVIQRWLCLCNFEKQLIIFSLRKVWSFCSKLCTYYWLSLFIIKLVTRHFIIFLKENH